MTQDRNHHRQTILLIMAVVLLVLLAGRPAAAGGTLSPSEHDLQLAAGPISPAGPDSGAEAAQTADGKALHLVQFKGPIKDAWLSDIEATGAELVHYVAEYGYLIWAGETARAQIDRMADDGSSYVRFSAPYTADLKAGRALRRMQTQAAAGETVVVTIQMLRHEGRLASEEQLDALIIEQLTPWDPVLNYQNMRAEVAVSEIETINNLPDVVWVGLYQPPELLDEVQAVILAGSLNSARTRPAGPGYLSWLRKRGFSENSANYPIIDITDDGIGNGSASLAAGDDTLRASGDPGSTSRIAYLNNCTQALDAGGPDGHGHINASIAGGYDKRGGYPYQDSGGYQLGLGVNPFGRLAGTRVFHGPQFDLSRCDYSYLAMLRQSYRAGARIVSNSWGCSSEICVEQYTPDSQAYDTAVRDADSTEVGNQEMLIMFSAGNSGVQASISSPANGKNVIAVGASENVRDEWTDSCGYGPTAADDAQDIAVYSSHGPAPGGRIKPDLVAPGTHVTGTASTSPYYNGSAICDKYYPDDQSVFAASTGTSHAVPAVAGLASLATFWLDEHYGIENPSPALLRAFLTAGSRRLTSINAGDDLPNNIQGFGLPDMNQTFDDRSRVFVEQGQGAVFNESGEFWKMRLQSVDSSLPVRIVMAFTDYPGAVWTDDPRVNDLDLIVNKNNEVYLGNVMVGDLSVPGGVRDEANTIEAVYLPAGTPATFEVTIEAVNIAGDGVPGSGDKTDQDFVLVCDNCRRDSIWNYDYHVYYPIFYP